MTIIKSFAVEYPFTELEVACPGLLADGVATLVHDQAGEFYVESFTLTGGETYRSHGAGHFGSYASRWLFEEVSKSLQSCRYAKKFFAEELEDYCQPSGLIAAE